MELFSLFQNLLWIQRLFFLLSFRFIFTSDAFHIVHTHIQQLFIYLLLNGIYHFAVQSTNFFFIATVNSLCRCELSLIGEIRFHFSSRFCCLTPIYCTFFLEFFDSSQVSHFVHNLNWNSMHDNLLNELHMQWYHMTGDNHRDTEIRNVIGTQLHMDNPKRIAWLKLKFICGLQFIIRNGYFERKISCVDYPLAPC